MIDIDQICIIQSSFNLNSIIIQWSLKLYWNDDHVVTSLRDHCNLVSSRHRPGHSVYFYCHFRKYYGIPLIATNLRFKVQWHKDESVLYCLPSQVQVNAGEGSDLSPKRRIQEGLQLGRGRREWEGPGTGESTEENWTARIEPSISPTIETVCQVKEDPKICLLLL